MNYLQGQKFRGLNYNDKIYYCNTHDVNLFFDNINFTHDFVLVSHNSDGNITDNPTRPFDADVRKIPKNLKKWFGQNLNYESEIIESLPIGLENSEWFPETRKIEKLFNINSTPKKIKNLVYLNLNIQNNPVVRQPIYDMLKDMHYVTVENGKNGQNFDGYLENIYNHNFVICPEGNGIDTHRLWECLYVKTIPIVKKNISYSFFEGKLPILFVDSWEEINEEFLIQEKIKIESNLEKNIYDLNILSFDFWENLINLEIKKL